MLVYHLRKTVQGAGGNMSYRTNKQSVAMPSKRTVGNGMVPSVYLGETAMKPTRVLQNIQIKRPAMPKKYITFE